jgi:hypothetical protein
MENPNHEPIAVSCKRGKSCINPPDDAPVYAVIRIQDGAPMECVLRPTGATWVRPCYYSGGTKVPCSQFQEIIEHFLKKHGSYYHSAVLYSIYCREYGIRWYAIFDSLWDGYCRDAAIVDVLDDDCIYLL